MVLNHERTTSFMSKLPVGIKENFISSKGNNIGSNFLSIHRNLMNPPQETKSEDEASCSKISKSSSESSSNNSITDNGIEGLAKNLGLIKLQVIRESIEVISEEPQASKAESTHSRKENESRGMSRKTTAGMQLYKVLIYL